MLFSGDTILYDNRVAAMLESHASNNAQYATWLLERSESDRDVAHGQPIEALPFAVESYRMMMFGRP